MYNPFWLHIKHKLYCITSNYTALLQFYAYTIFRWWHKIKKIKIADNEISLLFWAIYTCQGKNHSFKNNKITPQNVEFFSQMITTWLINWKVVESGITCIYQ
jgi:hypothetical protein